MSQPDSSDGYRRTPGVGPVIRTDIIDVYVFRRAQATGTGEEEEKHGGEGGGGGGGGVWFLQLLRSNEPLARTWHPVMGHIEPGESAVACAIREAREELGLDLGSPGALGFWALEQVHPFYLPALDQIVHSPRFCVEVAEGWEPVLNDEHTDFRWVDADEVERVFLWPGQALACREIERYIANVTHPARDRLRVTIP